MSKFFSKWLNYLNGNKYFVSFQVHCWLACTIIYHIGKFVPILWLALCFTVLTAWKEYYWDLHNEPNHPAWPEGTVDFGSYFTGTMLALLFHFTNT